MKNSYDEKIRIAFFAEILIEDFDGASRTMFQLIKRIDSERFDFLFVCGNGPSEIAGFPCLKIPSFTLPINRSYKLALPFLAKSKLDERLAQFDPHVIHIATPSLLGQYALSYAVNSHLPVITIYHTHFISYIDYYLRRARFLIPTVKAKMAVKQRRFYNRCDTIYIPSHSIVKELQQGGIDSYRMKIWKRGIDTHLFSPEKRHTHWINKIAGNQNKNILFASRLVWEKNLETLFRIYDLIKQRNLPYNLIVAGDGVATKASKKHMGEALFTGKLNHDTLSKLYASCDVFLFPSVSETYGNVVLEAMASGLPCVIADGGGSGDFVQNGLTGFKCEPFNEAEYVDNLTRILENEQLANSFRLAGLQLSQQLDWNKLADVYFEDLSNMAHSTMADLLPTC